MIPITNRQARVRSETVPAPVRGLNAKDGLASMKPDDAITLDNWFPETSFVRLRRGHVEHATGLTGPVETLMEFAEGTTRHMLAAANGGIYNVSASGAVGAALASGYTNNRWQWVNFGTAGGQFLIACNGEDAVINYDGSSIATTPAITGVTPSSLIHVNVFKNRLFFVERNTLSFWYLAVSSIGGAASEFDLSQWCSKGGELMAMGTWTRDGGDGLDDLAVFVTSRGEVLVYQGNDPGDAAAWSLVGVFHAAPPIGRRCLEKAGGDLIMLCEDGVVPLSRLLGAGRGTAVVALSDRISRLVNEDVRSHKDKFGWQAVLYPRGPYLLVNVPTAENATAHQYVANTITGAWCRFVNQNANCWGLFNDEIYFGGDGVVYKADTGEADDGGNIEADAKSAFNYFGHRGRLKDFKLCRPVLSANGSLTPAIGLNVDYQDAAPDSTPTAEDAGGAEWDLAEWDVADWASGLSTHADWQTVTGLGTCAALRMQVATDSLEVRWHATDFLFELGGYV